MELKEGLDEKRTLLCMFLIATVGAALIGMTKCRHDYNKLRVAYEAALGAFVTVKVPLANAAELESLKQAIHASQPTVEFLTNQKAFRADGSTYTVVGRAPVTDFGIFRRPDGTWGAGVPDGEFKEIKKEK